jgi:hypothetical protein
MADTICIVAFRVDTDRAVRYKKVPIESERKQGEFPTTPTMISNWAKVAQILRDAYEKDKADFVSIRFIREKK